ncbi:MAG: hypothetical protein IPO34_12645 [Dehalococcoidia bacterium]|nr:hypothetical protein [Dehalococcoidia bacterium]
MGQSDYWLRKAQTGRVTRRRFVGGITAAGAGAASLSLVGCGDDDDDDAAEPTSAPGGTTTAASPTTAPAVVDGGVYTGVWLGGTQFDSVDPHRGQRDEVGWLSSYVLNKIVRFSNPDTGDLEGDLAEKWETADSQTFTFAVRKDVKWQNTPITNGRQLTAQDLKWHIERQAAGKLLDGSAPSFRFKSDWTGVKVETPDDYTLKLTLPAPNGSFLTRLSAFFANVPNREATEKFEGAHGTPHRGSNAGHQRLHSQAVAHRQRHHPPEEPRPLPQGPAPHRRHGQPLGPLRGPQRLPPRLRAEAGRCLEFTRSLGNEVGHRCQQRQHDRVPHRCGQHRSAAPQRA